MVFEVSAVDVVFEVSAVDVVFEGTVDVEYFWVVIVVLVLFT